MEYTLAASASIGAVVALDILLRTHLLRQKRFWLFMLVMMFFLTVVNGYLTWRPIVLYGDAFNLGIRVFTIPIEDYMFGFGLISTSIIVWERLARTKRT